MKNVIPVDRFSKNTFSCLEKYRQIALLVDENTAHFCYPIIKDYLNVNTVIKIKSGEINKNLISTQLIWQALTSKRFTRDAVLINLGGGVISDMGGFAAATYKRGIDFVHIPTTLLSQVDACLGGKVGVNFDTYKNHIGVFQDPAYIFLYPGFLKTLNSREFRSGFAEVIKSILIADKNQWKQLIKNDFENQNWHKIIPHSLKIKYNITLNDKMERKGIRQGLNYGHTIGHALEGFFLKHPKRHLLHGEAIAIGMMCAGYLSWQKGFLTKEVFEEINNYILSVFSCPVVKMEEIRSISENTLHDKKNQGNIIQCVLLKNIGQYISNYAISQEELENSLKWYITTYL